MPELQPSAIKTIANKALEAKNEAAQVAKAVMIKKTVDEKVATAADKAAAAAAAEAVAADNAKNAAIARAAAAHVQLAQKNIEAARAHQKALDDQSAKSLADAAAAKAALQAAASVKKLADELVRIKSQQALVSSIKAMKAKDHQKRCKELPYEGMGGFAEVSGATFGTLLGASIAFGAYWYFILRKKAQNAK